MHLAYLDDSQDQTQSSIALFGALIIPNGEFGWAERMHSIAIEQLFSPDEIEGKFQEFHARDLFKGEGPFQGISERKRFSAIEVLLMALRHHNLQFIYSAVDVQRHAKGALSRDLFETAHPLVAAFKLCLLGVEGWAQSQHDHPAGVIKIDYNFIQRQLLKPDASTPDDSDEFYRKFSSQVICAKPEPEWTKYREFLLPHDGV